jgi:hypothetical protein
MSVLAELVPYQVAKQMIKPAKLVSRRLSFKINSAGGVDVDDLETDSGKLFFITDINVIATDSDGKSIDRPDGADSFRFELSDTNDVQTFPGGIDLLTLNNISKNRNLWAGLLLQDHKKYKATVSGENNNGSAVFSYTSGLTVNIDFVGYFIDTEELQSLKK